MKNYAKILARVRKNIVNQQVKQAEKMLDKSREDPVAMLRGQKSSSYLFKQPSVDGNTVSAGTSESKPELPSKNQTTNDLSMDYRNSVTQVTEDGTKIDPNPQSWQNTVTRPNRNGVPEHSTYVDYIEYNPNTQNTTVETRDGLTLNYTDENGDEWSKLENAGSKGQYVKGIS